MKILITGVAGFVGSTLARNLLSLKNESFEITGIDNFSFGYKERLLDIYNHIKFFQCDVAEIDTVLDKQKFDVIVHCAAIAPLPECQINSHRAIVQNVANCGSIADFALRNGTKNLIFFSSGAIYEGVDIYPTPEDVMPSPRLIYPSTKYMAEQYFQALCASHEFNVIAIRLFNLYGPHQDYFRKQPPLIGYLLKCLIEKEQAILFSSGTQCRDYLYIDDLVELVVAASKYLQSLQLNGNFVPVNAGAGIPVSVNEIIKMIEKISNDKIDVIRRKSEAYWDKYTMLFERDIKINNNVIEQEVEKFTHADIGRAMKMFSWSPKVSMYDGLAKCFNYAKSIIKR